MADLLRLACADIEAPPFFHASGGGQEPARLRAGRRPGCRTCARPPPRVAVRPWSEMLPSVRSGDADGVLCSSGTTAQRLELVDFTRPYAVFNESVLVRAGSGIESPEGLRGLRVGAIAGGTNTTLTETFKAAEPVAFSGTSDDVFGEMLEALRSMGDVDAVVDDDVALIPVADDPEFAIAFTAETRNRWGIAVSKHEPQLRGDLDGALERMHAGGELAAIWSRWMPSLPYPL